MLGKELNEKEFSVWRETWPEWVIGGERVGME